ncbi:MAG: 23S rRNA (pseudouridine(1915)-N(3))-methyltransferase RlmH [Bacteroidetes bacterium]|nr:23S rRNA (pseudouridine(1915)-N(3))-methyltransferase RlmH [Bacteroidota bacterium]
MKFEFCFIGKTSESYLAEGIERYQKKLVYYMNTEIKIIPASTEKNKTKALKEEAVKILKIISANDLVIVLDENGRQFSSFDLSKEIQRAMNQSYSKIIFIVGSAYGIDDSLKKRAHLMLSFSKFTFTHQMIRLMLVEQIYRSMTILKGESYHHD